MNLLKKKKIKNIENDLYKELSERQKKIRQQKKEEKETEKVDKKRLREMDGLISNRRKVKTTIPKTAQEFIPYIADYENGLIEVEPNKYSKAILFNDVNYQIARNDEQIRIFCKWGELINSISEDVGFSFTINNKLIDAKKLQKEIMLAEQSDNYNEYRKEYNSMLKRQFIAGKNEIQREKYITITLNALNPYDALQKFSKIEVEYINLLQKLGSDAKIMSTEERLTVLHDFYRPNNAGELVLDWDNIKMQGISGKDFIAPFEFYLKQTYIRIDDKYCRCLYVNNLPSSIVDTFLTDITDFDFPMMTTISLEPYATDKALKFVRRQITGMESMIVEKSKNAVKAGYDPEYSINHDLKLSHEEGKKLLADLQSHNQKMFKTTICMMYGANSLTELEENLLLLNNVARKYLCQLQVMKMQQRDGMKQILPLGHNILPLRRNLTTESVSVFIPFTSMELLQKNGIYYGLNRISRNFIMINRKSLNNGNGFMLGESGAGKSFTSKREIIGKLLKNAEECIYIIDPENEYGDLVTNLGGQVIRISPSSTTHINPFDLNVNYGADADPIIVKTDFILSICECITGGLSPAQKTIIDRCVRKVYAKYLQNFEIEYLPTLKDFYECVNSQNETEAYDLAMALEIYANGSLSAFAQYTNIDIKNRLVVFDIHELGRGLKNMGLLIVSDLIWNMICKNRNERETSVYIDEIYLMFQNELSEQFTYELFKRIRKYGGEVTGITQDVEELLKSDKARTMLSNCAFTIMLSQSESNRKILAELFGIGEEQMSYITNADKGCGLIRAAGCIIPFQDNFPKDLELYKLMTTNASEIKQFKEETKKKNSPHREEK